MSSRAATLDTIGRLLAPALIALLGRSGTHARDESMPVTGAGPQTS
jgi:hypothetical protein